MMLSWVALCSLLVVMGPAMVHTDGNVMITADAEGAITTDAEGNLWLHASLTDNEARVLIDGVDVGQEHREHFLAHVSEPKTMKLSITTAPTDMPVVFSGTVGCELDNVPPNVKHILGNISLISCPSLTADDLNVFNKLINVSGDLKIHDNDALTNVDGFGKLGNVGGNLSIQGNDDLTNVDGFGNLGTVGGDLTIQYNDVLTHVNGFGHLSSVGGSLKTQDNIDLTNVGGHNSPKTED
ncbi:uncharacterized protein MONBRDRAFT_26850 [Monosiga brevicollis MX1]|uniref:Auto-transporter adhesin head GIN domain-containing protein n=1 Tax=Monosiga brevicollis TaxID=81824 RepID=A9V3Q1_MONBE|nr:uncharacterized protein MONBRDRAFT_26850 [Monosiga brevicollis MX1]EDQ87850.1 predicted protein [Monosiga brevicollis MX1]|eukprot:XP_001747383.1 hypothetical protein [Monosiga brevicollis MX1]